MGPKIYVSATFDRKRVPNHLAEINNFFHIGLDVLDEMNTAILNSLNASGKNSSTFTLLKSIQVCQSVAAKIQVRLENNTHCAIFERGSLSKLYLCAHLLSWVKGGQFKYR